MLRRLGGDVVGMSTTGELIAASGDVIEPAAGQPVQTLGIAVVTNRAIPDELVAVHHDEVLAAAGLATDRLELIVAALAI